MSSKLLFPSACLLALTCVASVYAQPPDCTPGTVNVEPRNWFQDTFTSNEVITSSAFSAYDTTSAWIRTGLNLAQLTGNSSRQDLPGDSVVADAPGAGLRMDLVFRILPGPGNYVTLGNRNSGLRRVPTATTAAVANAASANFWESYLADNGAVGTGGDGTAGPGHPSGWDRNRWNSARCDTAETNIFPVEARLANMPALTPGRYMSMYHEADPKFATLGVPKNRCFLINPAGAINSTNITCGAAPFPPAWTANPATGRSPSEGGLAAGVTREYSQIIPDGQLTPGAHVQYFLRLSSEANPLTMQAMTPDTNFVLQPSGCSRDCARWAQFGVLPDRWKDPSFGVGGIGMACMLVIDDDDGSGDECAWVSVADSVGLTNGNKRGAHNGWGRAPPGASVDDPAYFVRAHGGQAGSLWDLYSVRGSRDTLTGNAGSLGSRGAPRCAGCPSSGRESRQGPTSVMLRNYQMVVVLSGHRSIQIFGPLADRGQNDISALQEFATIPGGSAQPRGLWMIGSGLGESESVDHASFLSQYLRASLRNGDYASFSGNSSPSITLNVNHTPPIGPFGLRPNSLDVFNVEVTAPPGQAQAYYENVGALGPYVASVFGPQSGPRPFVTLLDGFDLADLGNQGNTNTSARNLYANAVLSGLFGGLICGPLCGIGISCTDVPTHVDDSAFLSLASNPARGTASIRLVMPKAERARVAVYDVTGRRLKTLADGELEEGPHTMLWDGTDSDGARGAAGVYWVRVGTTSGIRAAKTFVLLR